MARTDAGAVLTAEHLRAQLAVRANAIRQFATLWPLWQGTEKTFDHLVTATIPLVLAHYSASSSLAAAYFDAFRRSERAPGAAHAVLAGPLDVARVTASLQVEGRVMTRKALTAGKSPQEAQRAALVRTSGSVTRHVMQGARDTLVQSVGQDPQAIGWARVTSGTPCAFCAMIASRGPVFLGHDTAEFQPHDHCACQVEPAYDGYKLAPDSRRWRSLYNQAQREARAAGELDRGTSNDALNALRRLLAAH